MYIKKSVEKIRKGSNIHKIAGIVSIVYIVQFLFFCGNISIIFFFKITTLHEYLLKYISIISLIMQKKKLERKSQEKAKMYKRNENMKLIF